MAKDPAVLFYTQDFLTGTFLMTNEQVGKYIRLLCLQQQNGGLNECDMLQVCGEKDDKIWAKFDFEDGKYYNKRMNLETTKRKKFCEHQRENINKRWGKDEEIGNTTVLPLELSNKKYEIRNKNKERISECEIKFRSEVFEFAEKYPEAMLDKFCNYWTEKNKAKTKMLFEMKTTFEVSKRLATWASRDKEYNKIEKTPENITYKELVDRHNEGKTDMANWEPITPGDKRSLWKLKR
jgi:hypothetical protein